MAHDVTPLFQPLAVKGKKFRNRVVMPPMVVCRDLTGEDGQEWYGQHAAGGVGLVIVEATGVVEFGSRLTAENMKPLVNAIHAGGALAAIQLYPGAFGQHVAPADLSADKVGELISRYRTAAAVCAAAGFDGIEPHGAHGFLLNQFFSPVQNKRTDEYGGGPEGRMRLAYQIVEAVKPIADSAGMLVLYRHTPVGKGYGIVESLVLAALLVKAGVDILDISPSGDGMPGERSAPFMALGVPVIAVNNMNHVERALETLREKRATLIAVGRGLIADPYWPEKVRSGRFEEIVECTDCDNCFGDLDRGEPVICAQWPKK